MKIKPTIGSVVAPTDTYHWGQVLILPTAYAAIEIHDESGNAQHIGLTQLKKLSDHLNDSVVSLQNVEAIAKDITHPCMASLVIIVPVGTIVYLVLVGSGVVILKREERLATLLDEAGSVSGELQSGDRLLLATKRFVETVGKEELAGIFDHDDTSTIAEKLSMRLAQDPAAVGSAGVVFGADTVVGFEEEPVEEVEAPKKIHFRYAFDGKNSIIRVAAIVSVAVFFASVVLGLVKQRQHSGDGDVIKSYIEAQHLYEEGAALLDLNPVKGRERLALAKTMIDPLVATVSAKTKTGRQIATLSKTINERLTISMQVYRNQPQLFYDAGLLKKGATISSVGNQSDKMVLLDSTGKTVFLLDVATKNGQIIGGGEEYGGARLVSMHGDKVYVVVSDGIHRVRLEDKKTEPLIIKKDDEWGTIGSLVSFGGNLYLLDIGKSRIWKYQPTEAGFSERREYLNPDTLPDFSRATNMAIDGTVWVGTTTGNIMRFVQGQEQSFVPKGVSPSFGKDLLVFTSDEVKHIYVLDSTNKRVVMLDKDGTYISQYVWESALQPTQVVASETIKKIFLVADGKIYALQMQ